MTSLNDRQRKELTPQVLVKQGSYFCVNCTKTPEDLIKIGVLPRLYIDHIDNDNDNDSIENLQFLCVSCNTKKNHPKNDPIDERKTDPVFVTSKQNMARAREYIMGIMIDPDEKRPEYHTLIDDMAEFIDCSQQAVKNYLAKMASKHGLFEWRIGQFGKSYLHFKDDYDLNKSVQSKF